MVPEPYEGSYGPTRTACFPSLAKLLFESDTIFDESGRIRESSCGGARQWQEDMDGLGVFDDGAVFLERGGLRQDFWHPGHEWYSCGIFELLKHHHLFVWEVRQF